MRKPLGKKALSYIKDILLESTSSEYNSVLEIYLSEGRYQLCTAGAVYSFEDKYINFFKTFKNLDWNKIQVKKVLLLGLGLASIPQMLEQKFNKDFEYTAVEIDYEIIRLAGKYILDELHSPLQTYEMDAEIFVEVTTEKFDMIIIDIFDNNIVPANFETLSFLTKTSNLLNKNGVVLFNRLNIDNNSHKSTMDYFDSVFKKVYPSAYPFFVRDNIIFCNRKDIIL